ncbi:helicase-related protein [Sphingomonas sp. CFBP 13720]|uniref:helicase-related protein n=1 Tax=Sphingomonas sp. CFBP 13720 TaxID=2775302 RepID=UPI001786A540|nr:helicase-related protein [Sphingomonas sp. CFBP 13720]MBD8678704.1 helicase [Sphingomonas sp. CFBP 13720]
MSQFARSPVTAVLGPTNTGKTYLAIERMCGHASGMIGFPLRLLARENYDRVVAMKGVENVALVTGEERIIPPKARWFLCTAESMPLERETAFVALDEAQLGADPERGHVFTDRLLRARGREETMILGSDALRPMVRALVKDAEIIGRPRFSTLSFAGARKLSRLPRRSAIVAFSAEEVYAVAEAIRRMRGGAAVVMGALSPRTRNAQVQMFQSGEVDYLVATDAIGMGLNLDVQHVAFASLRKFDGRRQRRLTVAEMAQIAGRAGRHHRDGTFGALVDDGPNAFTPEEMLAIEGHHVPPLERLYWRSGEPDFSSVDALVASLEERPQHPVLTAAPQAIDLIVLKRLAEEDWVRARTRSPMMVRRLWSACGLPDFRKLGPDPHARFVGRIFGHLSEGAGHLPHQWFADELQRLDLMTGDVETIAGRIAAVRSWAYIAHRADWLMDPEHWAARTRGVEEKLSDALHDRLRQRFVDQRTTVLLRRIGAGAADLPVDVGSDGVVSVDGHDIGRLNGFRFEVSPDTTVADKRLLIAAAEKGLVGELAKRAAELAVASDAELSLAAEPGSVPRLWWSGLTVATMTAGPTLDRPAVTLDRSLHVLDRAAQAAVRDRLAAWIAQETARHVPTLTALAALARDPAASGALRAVAASLTEVGGIAPRDGFDAMLTPLESDDRRRLRKAGVTIGTLDLFDARLFRPAAAAWRAALLAARDGRPVEPLAPVGASVLPAGQAAWGYRRLGAQAVRVDLIERLARTVHDARKGAAPFAPDPALATSMGLKPDTIARLMAQLGFRPSAVVDAVPHWRWGGMRKPTPPAPKPAVRPGNAFGALADLGFDR